MKIISKTKDYYDHIANVLGVDEKLRYERKPFESRKTPDGSIWYPETVEFTLDRNTESSYEKSYKNSPFFKRVNKVNFNDKRTVKALFLGGRAFTAWSDIIGNDPYGDVIHNPALVREEVECPDWLNSLSVSIDQPVFIVVYLQRGSIFSRAGKVHLMNMPPNLSDIGLPRLLDAFSVYSSIQTWLENTKNMNSEQNKEHQFDNTVKIQAAGFDLKTSFRKR